MLAYIAFPGALNQDPAPSNPWTPEQRGLNGAPGWSASFRTKTPITRLVDRHSAEAEWRGRTVHGARYLSPGNHRSLER